MTKPNTKREHVATEVPTEWRRIVLEEDSEGNVKPVAVEHVPTASGQGQDSPTQGNPPHMPAEWHDVFREESQPRSRPPTNAHDQTANISLHEQDDDLSERTIPGMSFPELYEGDTDSTTESPTVDRHPEETKKEEGVWNAETNVNDMDSFPFSAPPPPRPSLVVPEPNPEAESAGPPPGVLPQSRANAGGADDAFQPQTLVESSSLNMPPSLTSPPSLTGPPKLPTLPQANGGGSASLSANQQPSAPPNIPPVPSRGGPPTLGPPTSSGVAALGAPTASGTSASLPPVFQPPPAPASPRTPAPSNLSAGLANVAPAPAPAAALPVEDIATAHVSDAAPEAATPAPASVSSGVADLSDDDDMGEATQMVPPPGPGNVGGWSMPPPPPPGAPFAKPKGVVPPPPPAPPKTVVPSRTPVEKAASAEVTSVSTPRPANLAQSPSSPSLPIEEAPTSETSTSLSSLDYVSDEHEAPVSGEVASYEVEEEIALDSLDIAEDIEMIDASDVLVEEDVSVGLSLGIGEGGSLDHLLGLQSKLVEQMSEVSSVLMDGVWHSSSHALLQDLLFFYDFVDMRMKNLREQGPTAEARWQELSSVQTRLVGLLAQHGLSPLGVEEMERDPSCCRVMQEVITMNPEEDGRIARLLRQGFRLGNKVFRPAEVEIQRFPSHG
ncbi:MAG: nucleotide exchange factor GrpE [Deltaproteobacteria bacterium]|nr:MAG: nucleotide exchange factor GrpE [Deltaproteobacteria bacterium]